MSIADATHNKKEGLRENNIYMQSIVPIRIVYLNNMENAHRI